VLLTLAGNPNGPLDARNGLVGATTSIGVSLGGTGLTGAPSYGQMLVGNSFGGYNLVATSSLGIISGGTPGGSSGQVQFNNAGSFGGSSSLVWDSSSGRLGIGTSSPGAP